LQLAKKMLAVTGVLALLGSASASLVSPTIPGAYIVKYRNDATAEWEAAKSFFASPEAQQGANKFTVKYEYSIGEHFKGFALRADGPGAQAALQSMPGVEFAEPERIGEIDDSRTDCTQEDATWGLDRLDQQALPLDKLYKHQCEAGEDVLAFIADTGIYPNEDLEGRIVEHQCFPSNDPNCDADCQGCVCFGIIDFRFEAVVASFCGFLFFIVSPPLFFFFFRPRHTRCRYCRLQNVGCRQKSQVCWRQSLPTLQWLVQPE
jgi:hypothetical protein